MHDFTPEKLYADTRRKRDLYHQLSGTYAIQQDSYRALHAMFASDVHAIQSVMWERIMATAPDPDEQFLTIAGTIARGLASYAGTIPGHSTAHEAATTARAAMTNVFDRLVRVYLDEALLPTVHLAALPDLDPYAGQHVREARIKGRDVTELSTRRVAYAEARMTAAREANQTGDTVTAMRQAWQADWATYEAYLFDAATQIGDHALITVDMRWQLATDALANLDYLPTTFEESVNLVRLHLLDVIGSVEAEQLEQRLLPIH